MFLLSTTGPGSGLAVFVILFFIAAFILLALIAAKMASKRGRNSGVWFFLAILISPFLAYLILFLIGETEEAHRQRILQEEAWRKLM